MENEIKTLKKQWLESLQKGTLVRPKHDPHFLEDIHGSYRSVISNELANPIAFRDFIESEEYEIHRLQYEKHTQPCYVIVPNSNSGYDVCASGVPSMSNTPNEAFDTLIFAQSSGGWHVYGESSDVLQSRVDNGSITCLED
jgi:hypothetical protein